MYSLVSAAQVTVVVVASHETGAARRGEDELRSSHAAFLAQHTVPMETDLSTDSGSSRSTVRMQQVANRWVT